VKTFLPLVTASITVTINFAALLNDTIVVIQIIRPNTTSDNIIDTEFYKACSTSAELLKLQLSSIESTVHNKLFIITLAAIWLDCTM